MNALLPLGTKTMWGKIGAVGITGGERYYWMVDEDGGVAMMPAFVVEQDQLPTSPAGGVTSAPAFRPAAGVRD